MRRDDAYIEELEKRVAAAFGRALETMQEAEIGLGSCFEFNVAHNRRVVMRDGTVVEVGTWEELLGRDSVLKSLAAAQQLA